MAVVFGKPATAQSSKRPVLADTFARDLTVIDESDGDAGTSANALRVITNYRGFTKDKPGRKAALVHQTVLDLSAIGQCIPLGELSHLIASLQQVEADLAEVGVLGGKGDPLAK